MKQNEEKIPVLEPMMDVLVRDGDNDTWVPSVYGYTIYKLGGIECYICSNGVRYRQCIPAYSNYDLLGTSNPDPYEHQRELSSRFFPNQLVAVSNTGDEDDWHPMIFTGISAIPNNDRPYLAKPDKCSGATHWKYCLPVMDKFEI